MIGRRGLIADLPGFPYFWALILGEVRQEVSMIKVTADELQRQAVYPWELPPDLREALDTAEPPEDSRRFNDEV
ncbi:hypothetical protein [Afifella marina]|uniref:hypothetical protein n=1 Tax=Afifella marina TaxID=1080 RepID=UPI001114165C|nr:hypothetical protein [Afifella marina]